MAVTLSDVAGAIEAFSPVGLAESWDRPGLQIGDPRAPVRTVLVALDPSPRAVSAAVGQRAQLLATHHPLLLDPLDRVDTSTPAGRIVSQLLLSGVGLYSAHTNLDRAEGGVNDALARRLGIEHVRPFGQGEPQVKAVVVVPVGSAETLRRAVADDEISACRVWRCSCAGAGPVEGARLEAVIPRRGVGPFRRAVASVDPGLAAAIEVYDLANPSARCGPGRLGRLPRPRRASAWALEVARAMGADGAKLSGPADAWLAEVAVCGGSGSSFWREARKEGAQVLVTGDVKYHTALEAAAEGFCLLDLGHAASERVAVEVMADAFRRWAERAGIELDVRTFWDPDVFLSVAG